MNQTAKQDTARSWMQRLRVDGSKQPGTTGEPSKAPTQATRRRQTGWDPYDVWLSRIERPRRRRESFPAP